MKILVINCGSSSLKYQLIDMENENVIAKGLCEKIGLEGSSHTYAPASGEKVVMEKALPTHLEAVELVLSSLTDEKIGVIKSLDEINAIGHRVVQGGEKYNKTTLITDDVINQVESLTELAPLHNPANVIGIKACREKLPNTPMAAIFDTAYHQTLPDYAYMYAVPYEMYENDRVRKYGFHGTSHNYVAIKTAEILNKPLNELNIICCHLGNGSSITAIKNGESVDTTMGFTPLDGIMMGTRSGSIDPAILPYIMPKYGIKPEGLNDFMNKKCGMNGVSGISSDFRDLQAVKDTNNRARLALDMFAYQAKKYIGSYFAVLNGKVDALVFTAGIGENDFGVREAITNDLEGLGIVIDKAKNDGLRAKKEEDITGEGSKVKVFVVPTNEELMIARSTAELVK